MKLSEQLDGTLLTLIATLKNQPTILAGMAGNFQIEVIISQAPEKKIFDQSLPGTMGNPSTMPSGYKNTMSSPTWRPKAAPTLKSGMSIPEGTGRVEATAIWNT